MRSLTRKPAVLPEHRIGPERKLMVVFGTTFGHHVVKRMRRAPDPGPHARRAERDRLKEKSGMERWYLIHTKPAGEATAVANLERQGYHVYYPRLLRPRRIRGRWQERIEPLFPRYLILRLALGSQTLGPVRSTLGVHDVVRFGVEYAIVSNEVVEALKRRADPDTGLHRLTRQRLFTFGAMIRITAGPFEGLEGVFEREEGQERVVVLLSVLGKATTVRISAGLVTPKEDL